MKHLIIACVLTCLVGCISAEKRQAKQARAVQEAKNQLTANSDAQMHNAQKNVYAAGLALNQETNPSPAVVLAADFTQMAQVSLGQPHADDVISLRRMVDGLLSTNAQMQAQARYQREDLNKELVRLQTANASLQAKLEQKENKRDAGYEVAAAKATEYDKWRHRILWIVGIVGGGLLLTLLLPALSLAFPVLAPFSAIASSVTGTAVRSVLRIVPQAMNSAGVVAQGMYDVSEATLKDVVLAIQTVKQQKPEVFEEYLAPELKDKTSKEVTRKKIAQVKDTL